MLALHRESQRRIHSFQLSIKHDPFAWRFQCKVRVGTGHIQNNII